MMGPKTSQVAWSAQSAQAIAWGSQFPGDPMWAQQNPAITPWIAPDGTYLSDELDDILITENGEGIAP